MKQFRQALNIFMVVLISLIASYTNTDLLIMLSHVKQLRI